MSGRAVPVARAAVRGAFRVPPSKSLHQRALVLAALSAEPCEIVARGGPVGEDAERLAAALGRLGTWRDGALGASRDRLVLDLGLGATGFRFATACAALRPAGARTLLRGRPALLARPHGSLLRALERLGARVKRRHSGAVRVLGGRIRGRDLSLPGTTSSQYASALLLIGPRIGGLRLRLLERTVSAPYLRLTIEALRAFGVAATAEGLEAPGARLAVPEGAPLCARYVVPPDASAAAAWWTAAALTGGEASVEGLGRGSPQADAVLLPLLERMGARVLEREGTATVRGPERLRGTGEVDLRDAPDLLPLVAVLAATAEGETRVRGVAHARAKETDRLDRVARGLEALGARVSEEEDGLRIVGGPLRGGVVDARGDHRLAFAFGVLGLAVPGLVLLGAEAVGKSHPGFWADLSRAAGEPSGAG
jgi:3-phosphoshikimate 1-carboxyvinyltransferase